MTNFTKTNEDFKDWVDANVHQLHEEFSDSIPEVATNMLRMDAWEMYKNYDWFRTFILEQYMEIIRDELESAGEEDADNLII